MMTLGRHQTFNGPRYSSSFAPKAAPAGGILPGSAPLPRDGGGGGGATPAMVPLPAGAGNLSNFQKSVNLERANDAQSAATFAAAAPLPKGPNGAYHGAYGDGPDAEKLATAGKAAFVGRQQNVANAQDFGEGTNYFRNQEVEDQALHPAIDPEKQAKIDQMTAKTRAIDKWTGVIPDSQAHGNEAGAELKGAQARQTDALTQPKVEQAGADTALKTLRATAPNPLIAKVADANARTMTSAAQDRHKRLVEQYDATMRSMKTAGIDPDVAKELHDRAARLQSEIAVAAKAEDDATGNAMEMRNATTRPTAAPNPSPAQNAPRTPRVSPVTPGASPQSNAGGGFVPNLRGATPGPIPAPAVAASANPLHTPENIEYTAQHNGISVDEVKRRLGIA